MKIYWSVAAQADLGRLYDFLALVDAEAAAAMLDRLIGAPEDLLPFVRRGSRPSEFDPREVREFRVAGYIIRYEVRGPDLYVLRLFHAREDRH